MVKELKMAYGMRGKKGKKSKDKTKTGKYC